MAYWGQDQTPCAIICKKCISRNIFLRYGAQNHFHHNNYQLITGLSPDWLAPKVSKREITVFGQEHKSTLPLWIWDCGHSAMVLPPALPLSWSSPGPLCQTCRLVTAGAPTAKYQTHSLSHSTSSSNYFLGCSYPKAALEKMLWMKPSFPWK